MRTGKVMVAAGTVLDIRRALRFSLGCAADISDGQ